MLLFLANIFRSLKHKFCEAKNRKYADGGKKIFPWERSYCTAHWYFSSCLQMQSFAQVVVHKFESVGIINMTCHCSLQLCFRFIHWILKNYNIKLTRNWQSDIYWLIHRFWTKHTVLFEEKHGISTKENQLSKPDCEKIKSVGKKWLFLSYDVANNKSKRKKRPVWKIGLYLLRQVRLFNWIKMTRKYLENLCGNIR